jgi:TRAP-type mannitol/chloroaromatic compound transport system substrate-binding protein
MTLEIIIGVTAYLLLGCGTNNFKGRLIKNDVDTIIYLEMITSWPEWFYLQESAERINKKINENNEVYFAGELVPALEVFDVVGSGEVEFGHTYSYYFYSKHIGWNYFTNMPLGLSKDQMNYWLLRGGGQQLWDQLGEKINLKCFPAGIISPIVGIWSKKEINTIEDFKGLKIRMPGFLGGFFTSDLKVSTILMPILEIYSALETGMIDAAYLDLIPGEKMKINEVCKYFYPMPFLEPCRLITLAVNKPWFNSITPTQQENIRKNASSDENVLQAEIKYLEKNAMDNLTKKGLDIKKKLPKDIIEELKKRGKEYLEKMGLNPESDLHREIHNSFMEARKI